MGQRTPSGIRSRVNMGHLFGELEMLSEPFASLVGMYEAGRIKARVDRAFTFSAALLAHHHLHHWKVILGP